MNKAIFLDRDGTINVDYGYVHEIDKLEFIPGVIEGLKILQDMGYLLIIVTNQSGIGRGMYDLKAYRKFNRYMLKELEKHDIHITDVFMCPHTDEDNCECRKPKLKMYYDAIKKYDIDVENSYTIGDRPRDISLCKKEKVKGILISQEENKEYLCKDSLYQAALYIKENN